MNKKSSKKRAPRNQTLTLSPQQREKLAPKLLRLEARTTPSQVEGKTLCQDFFKCASYLPREFVDLLILDPPYNLTKNYHGHFFRTKKAKDYVAWFRKVVDAITPLLKPNASIYVCSDWKTSNLVFPVLDERFFVRNRITWEREKGRGANANWKNNTEDIWFCTKGNKYTFHLDAVKMKRRVLAPYRTQDGTPKDWEETNRGKFRLTHPSNIWTDITVPFWSMKENTDHPTQKPEKLLAKMILASSNPGDLVLDPFLGSGTTAVVAKKLNRRYVGIEIQQPYCCWAEKRLLLAEEDPEIQGFSQGVFWERNTKIPD